MDQSTNQILSKRLVLVLSGLGLFFVILFGSIFLLSKADIIKKMLTDNLSWLNNTTSSGYNYKVINESLDFSIAVVNENRLDQLLREFPEIDKNGVTRIQIISSDDVQESNFGWETGRYAYGYSYNQADDSNLLEVTIMIKPDYLHEVSWSEEQISNIVERMLVSAIVDYHITDNHHNPTSSEDSIMKRLDEVNNAVKVVIEDLNRNSPGNILETKIIEMK